MKVALIFAFTLTITCAAPGRYRQQYQFSSSSSSYKNNELQHKEEEAGAYAKHGDTESGTKPQEESQYVHQQYRKPGFDQELAVTAPRQPNLGHGDFLEKLRQEHERLGLGKSTI